MLVNDIEIGVEHKPIKNIHLAVYPPDGRVHISAPLETSDVLLKSYVMRKMAWIIEKREVLTSYARQEPREYVSGEAHYYLGALYRLKVTRSNIALQHVERNGDYLEVFVRESANKEHIENVLFEWYREQLKPIIANFIEKWSSVLKIAPNDWEVRLMTSKWGSCTRNNKRLLFNLQLAKKPIECLEYVILHELAHLKIKGHNKEFVALLDKYMPYWRDTRKLLNELKLDYMEDNNDG